MASEDRYVFLVEWFDSMASLVRTYNLTYYPKDKTIEMVTQALTSLFQQNFQYDLKTKKLFLRRCEYPSIALKDMYIGAIITVYSRQLKVVDYADVFTRKQFESKREK